jgi:hypothetical protein
LPGTRDNHHGEQGQGVLDTGCQRAGKHINQNVIVLSSQWAKCARFVGILQDGSHYRPPRALACVRQSSQPLCGRHQPSGFNKLLFGIARVSTPWGDRYAARSAAATTHAWYFMSSDCAFRGSSEQAPLIGRRKCLEAPRYPWQS